MGYGQMMARGYVNARTAREEPHPRVKYECATPTQTLGHCKRPATVHFARRDGICVQHLCAQHAKGAGAAKLLRPMPWEYDHIERY